MKKYLFVLSMIAMASGTLWSATGYSHDFKIEHSPGGLIISHPTNGCWAILELTGPNINIVGGNGDAAKNMAPETFTSEGAGTMCFKGSDNSKLPKAAAQQLADSSTAQGESLLGFGLDGKNLAGSSVRATR